MDAEQIEQMNKLRASAAEEIERMAAVSYRRLGQMAEVFAVASLAAAAANAPNETPVAGIEQSFGDIKVRIAGKGSDLKRAHLRVRLEGWHMANRYANEDNSYVSLTYHRTKGDWESPTFQIVATFPSCQRVEVGEVLVKQYKTVCGDDASRFQTVEEMEA
jgi:hypothetical protein